MNFQHSGNVIVKNNNIFFTIISFNLPFFSMALFWLARAFHSIQWYPTLFVFGDSFYDRFLSCNPIKKSPCISTRGWIKYVSYSITSLRWNYPDQVEVKGDFSLTLSWLSSSSLVLYLSLQWITKEDVKHSPIPLEILTSSL